MSKSGNGFTDTTFEFFAGLEANNDRDWFDQHRATYQEYARDPFASLLEEVSDRLAGTSMPLHGSSDTMFRINRDLRFTNDKRPYSESVSGLLTPDGTKDESGRLVYVQVDANGGRVGGGMHRPNAAALKPVRRRIIDQPEAFDHVLDDLERHGLSIDTDNQVATMPRGFTDHAEHRHAKIVRCTQLLAMAELPKSAFLDDTVADRIVDTARGLASLYDFIEATS